MSRTEAQLSIVVGLAFTIMILLAIFEEFSYDRLSVLFILLFWVPLLVLHEAGHAIAARLLGWRVREIVIGFGRELWRWKLGETRVVIKLAPIEGYVLPAPTSAQHMRLKSALIYAAGPGAELLLLAAMLLVLGKDYVFGSAGSVEQVAAYSLAIAILLGAGFNLLPFSTGGAVSDGLGILSSPFMSEETIQLRLLAVELREITRLLESGSNARALDAAQKLLRDFPDNRALQAIYASTLAADRQLETAREFVRRQLATAGDEPGTTLAWLQRQARIELEAEEPAWLVFDLALQKATALAPGNLENRALKAMSMVLRGSAAEGGEQLAETWRSNHGEIDDAELLAYLAIAAHRVGDRNASGRFRSVFDSVNKSARLRALVSRHMSSA